MGSAELPPGPRPLPIVGVFVAMKFVFGYVHVPPHLETSQMGMHACIVLACVTQDQYKHACFALLIVITQSMIADNDAALGSSGEAMTQCIPPPAPSASKVKLKGTLVQHNPNYIPKTKIVS